MHRLGAVEQQVGGDELVAGDPVLAGGVCHVHWLGAVEQQALVLVQPLGGEGWLEDGRGRGEGHEHEQPTSCRGTPSGWRGGSLCGI